MKVRGLKLFFVNHKDKKKIKQSSMVKNQEKKDPIFPKNGIIGASRKLERQHEFLQS